jgi:tetratricopeptide (TPR) repeat protein
MDAAKIGLELGVHYLVEGSASLRGSILYVNVALVDARTRLHVWSGHFERTGADRQEFQAEIINSIARELRVSVAAAESARTSNDPDVQTLIFKGYGAIQASRHHGVDGLRPAEQYFLQALARDPDALRANIGLGVFHAHMAIQLFAPDPAPHLAKAEEILQSIIARHPSLSEPHHGMGLVHVARREAEKAIASFERTLKLDPSHAPAHAQMGRALVRIGREREGLDHILYAMRLSPRDPVIGYWMAFAGYAELELGNYGSAIAYLERAHALNPTQPRTTLSLISANVWAGNPLVARQLLADLQTQHPHLTPTRLREMYGGAKGKKNAAGILRASDELARNTNAHN